jgi:hypothetical protein
LKSQPLLDLLGFSIDFLRAFGSIRFQVQYQEIK